MNKLPRDIHFKLSEHALSPHPAFKKNLLNKIRKGNTMAQKTNPVAQFFARSPYIGLGAVLTLLVVVGGTSAIAAKNRTENAALREIEIPQNLNDVVSIETVRASALQFAPVNSSISSIELEQEEGTLIYRVRYSDGSVRYFDANTGLETNKPVESANSVPANFSASTTLQQAREIAQDAFPSKTIIKIELEKEDGVIIYSIKFNDDSRVDIDASTGAIVRTKNGNDSTIESESISDVSSDEIKTEDKNDSHESGSQNSGSGSGNSGSSGSNSGSGSGSGNENDD